MGTIVSPKAQFHVAERFRGVRQRTMELCKPLTPEDNEFLKTNAPQFVDKAATKDKTKVVAGTNFNLEEGNLEMLKKRFVVEDYSAK